MTEENEFDEEEFEEEEEEEYDYESDLDYKIENVVATVSVEIAEKIDLFLCDIKHMDGDRHEEFTGVDNSLILANIKRLACKNKDIIIRIPIVPGFNEDDANIEKTAEYVAGLKVNCRVDILPYNRCGGAPGRQFGSPDDIFR